VDLRDYLQVIRRRWLIIAVCVLVGTAGAALMILRATPQYSSTVRLFVSTPSTDANAQAYQGGLFSQQRVTAYADLIKGSTIAERVIERLDIDQSPLSLVNQISASAAPQSVILEITVTDPSPERAQELAQTTAEVFTGYVSELEGAASPDQSPIKANIVDAASFPTSPVSPRPLQTIGLGAILGLLLGLALAWLRETLDQTVKTPATLEDATGAASLGSIFFDPAAAKSPLITTLDPYAPRVESFRVLRTNLQFLDADKKSRIFTITSPLPNEGKSTTAINIALALSQAGQRTLLLEADLRRPRISEYLDLEPMVGLTTLLIGRADIDEVIQAWGDSGLHVITGGSIPPNPAELLQSRAMHDLLAQLRERYDVVIIDAPPTLPVTDAALLGALADGVILVARHAKTTRDQAAQSAARLESAGARLLATVLNFVPDRGAQSYGYGYGYGPAGTGARQSNDMADGPGAGTAGVATSPPATESTTTPSGVPRAAGVVASRAEPTPAAPTPAASGEPASAGSTNGKATLQAN
jgi:capsular exopolysaccharide synthesis family protein